MTVLLFINVYLFPQKKNLNRGAVMMTDAMRAGIPRRTELLMSCSHVPSATARRVLNVVIRSGHFRAHRGYRVERRGVSGHEFLYCLSGSGYVALDRKCFRVEPFHLAWLSGFGAHGADRTAPWEVLWMHVEGHQVEKAWEVLSVQERPVFDGLPSEARGVFQDVNDLLANRPSAADAALNCRVAELLGYLVESREAARPRKGHDTPEVRFAIEQMAGDPKRSWRGGKLAKLCGVSERHFFRRFKLATGLSPISWLRRERVSLAQGKLLEGAKSIKEISGQVGYNDVFFFSRDFKRHTGFSPSTYRRERSDRRAAMPSAKPNETPGQD